MDDKVLEAINDIGKTENDIEYMQKGVKKMNDFQVMQEWYNDIRKQAQKKSEKVFLTEDEISKVSKWKEGLYWIEKDGKKECIGLISNRENERFLLRNVYPTGYSAGNYDNKDNDVLVEECKIEYQGKE